MRKLENYIQGKWIEGEGDGKLLYNAITGDPIYIASTTGIDFGDMLNYGRVTGGEKLRKMTFQERGLMLKALAMYLRKNLDKYYQISYLTGATKIDSWVDIEGMLLVV